MRQLLLAFSIGCLLTAGLILFVGQGLTADASPQAAAAPQTAVAPQALQRHAVDPGPIRPGRWTSAIWMPSRGNPQPTVLAEAEWPASTRSEIAKLRAGQKKWPPMFPNAYATKVFENEKVTVYDSTLGETDRLHRHTRDLIAIYIQDDGMRRDISVRDGQPFVYTTREDQDTANGTRVVSSARYNGAPLPHVSSYVPAGVLHSEAAVDPAKNGTRRVFFVELKGTEPADCAQWSTAC